MSNSSTNPSPIIDFSKYIAERTEHFTGRAWVFKEIDNWLANPEGTRYYVLTGEPGSGKSAVAARLAEFSSGVALPPPCLHRIAPGFVHGAHFCRATASDWIDPRTFARSISLQLTAIPKFALALKEVGDKDKQIIIDVKQEVEWAAPGSTITGVHIQNLVIQGLNGQEAFNRTVLDPLRTIYNMGYDQDTILLVDSLDEALTTATEVDIVALLAGMQALDKRVRVIMTSRPEPQVLKKFILADGLSLSDSLHSQDNNQDIAEYINVRLPKADVAAPLLALSEAQRAVLPGLIASKSEGNFQYVTFLLKAVAEGKQDLDELPNLPAGLEGLYFTSFDRIIASKKKDWTTAYKPLIGVLSVAKTPLLLEQIQNLSGQLSDIGSDLLDLRQFVEPAPSIGSAPDDGDEHNRYRFYHQSVVAFLGKRQLKVSVNGNTRSLDNIYQIAAEDWHSSIVRYYRGTAGSWTEKDWSKVDAYGLHYLTAHLYALRAKDGYSDQLHALLETRPFVDQRLDGSANPNPTLDDLRLGLDLALQENSLAHVWQHILDYRRALSRAQDFQQLAKAVWAGDYSAALERTMLYSALPNAQAFGRLWIAWVAAANGQNEVALTSARQALDHVPPRGVMRGAIHQEDSEAASSVGDAIGEAFQRLLLRIARTVGPTLEEQTAWLKAAARSWPPNAIQDLNNRLTESVDAWGAIFDAQGQHLTMSQLLDQLASRTHGIDAAVNFREASFFYQRQLGAGLFNTLGDPQWLEYVKRAVALVALDDYPSYREMALAWISSAVLAQANEDWARTAFSTILAGMFKPSPGFWGDSIVAALDGMHKESQQPADPNYVRILKDVEAKNDRSVDPTAMSKPDDVIAWRASVGLPTDPWSFQMRRQSAIAAVLYRRGDVITAEQDLWQAAQASPQGSYAGYRTLAHLSLACRWLEWNNPAEALTQVKAAGEDASHMLDPVLRKERLDLVQKMSDWLSKYHGDPTIFDQQDSVSLVQQETGMARLVFLEFLSAIWHADTIRLRQLIPLALEDATTIDAILGRLLGLEVQQIRPSRPFLNLCGVMNLSSALEE